MLMRTCMQMSIYSKESPIRKAFFSQSTGDCVTNVAALQTLVQLVFILVAKLTGYGSDPPH